MFDVIAFLVQEYQDYSLCPPPEALARRLFAMGFEDEEIEDALNWLAALDADAEGRALLSRVAERFGLSARGYHRVLRVARTIADLDASATVRQPHVAEALGYRLALAGGTARMAAE